MKATDGLCGYEALAQFCVQLSNPDDMLPLISAIQTERCTFTYAGVQSAVSSVSKFRLQYV